MSKFPASVPRKMFWADRVGGTSNCPECKKALQHEYHTYLVATREYGDIQTSIAGNHAGYFCEDCPIVVLDGDIFAQALSWESETVEFAVMGLVDLDAVHDDKANIPLGEDDNPVSLVEFTNLEFKERKTTVGKRLPKRKRASRKRVKRDKRRRK